MSLRARISLLLTLLALAAAANLAALYLMNREVVAQHREVRATTNLITDLSSLRYQSSHTCSGSPRSSAWKNPTNCSTTPTTTG
jgi:CHASE3 domain sensor protein